jgi:hypothetical protein
VLSGTGTVGAVTAGSGATVSPGNGGVGTLRTGGLTVSAGGRLAIDMTFTGADRVTVTGPVRLGGDLALTFANGFGPALGTRYRLIDNDGTDAVAGASFTGLSEGSIVRTFGNAVLRLTFTGGDGNDVELVAAARPRRLAVGAGAGGQPLVKVFDAAGTLVREFNAYDAGFRGGVRVAQGDFTGDGVDDIVTAPGSGGGPHVRVWDGATGALLNEFFAYETSFTGGVSLAVGEVAGDGQLDIVTGTGDGGGPLVRVFSQAGVRLGEFFAYDTSFRGGVSVAAGDVTGDGRADIVTGAGKGGASHVEVFTSATGALASSFFAFDNFFGGIAVAVANGSVAVAPLAGGGPVVRTFTRTGGLVGEFIAYQASFRGGVTLAAQDVDGDGVAEIVTGTGAGGGPLVSAFTAAGVAKRNFFAFDPAFLGGIFVG